MADVHGILWSPHTMPHALWKTTPFRKPFFLCNSANQVAAIKATACKECKDKTEHKHFLFLKLFLFFYVKENMMGSRMVLRVTFHGGLLWTLTKQSSLHVSALSLLHRVLTQVASPQHHLILLNGYQSSVVSACMISYYSHVQLLATRWTVDPQDPLSMGFSRQRYWSGLPFPSLGDLPNPGIEPESLRSPALAGRFFITSATWMMRKSKWAWWSGKPPGAMEKAICQLLGSSLSPRGHKAQAQHFVKINPTLTFFHVMVC